MATFIEVFFFFKLRFTYNNAYTSCEAPAIATKIETAGTQEVQQGFEEIKARCDRFYNSFYRRRHICLSGFQADELFRIFLPVLSFILLCYLLIKSENGTQEICLSLYRTHLTRAFLFFLFIIFSILNIFSFAGKALMYKRSQEFFHYLNL